MSTDSTGHSVLLPPEPQEGGLIVIKPGSKRNPNLDGESASVEFKVPLPPTSSDKPRISLLGLDRLAEAKRRERLQQQQQEHHTSSDRKKDSYHDDETPTSKRSKVYSYKDGEAQEQDYSERRVSNTKDDQQRSRHYRDRETGATDKATPTPHHRLYHQDLMKDSRSSSSSSKSKGIYASSTSNKHGNKSSITSLLSLF